jgi:(S)-ureidoglycine aminohydrolase
MYSALCLTGIGHLLLYFLFAFHNYVISFIYSFFFRINTLGAYLISPAIGAHFTMYLAKMHDGSKSALPPKGVERLIFVLQGSILLSEESGNTHTLLVDSYAYLPANMKHSVISDEVTTLVIFERRYNG